MSMIAYVLGITPIQIIALRTTPSLVGDLGNTAQVTIGGVPPHHYLPR